MTRPEPLYLIIAGTTRAGTTSLFRYLGDHPDVCPSRIKETGFFLDADYPNPPPTKYRVEGGLEKYECYFSHCQRQSVRLEATPGYMYSPGTAQKIRTSLRRVKLLFILRDPVGRLISAYRFAKQNGRIPQSIDFAVYVERQYPDKTWNGIRDLMTGRYARYLRAYFELFDRQDIFVASFSALSQSPGALLADICFFGGLDNLFYRGYDFGVINPSRTINYPSVHRLYLSMSKWFSRTWIARLGWTRSVFGLVRRYFEPLYLHWVGSNDEPVNLPPSLEALLTEYYAEERSALARLLGQDDFAW